MGFWFESFRKVHSLFISIISFPNPILTKPEYKYTLRPYSEVNQGNFIDKLIHCDWNSINQIDNITKMLSDLTSLINSTYFQCFPKKRKLNKSQTKKKIINHGWLQSLCALSNWSRNTSCCPEREGFLNNQTRNKVNKKFKEFKKFIFKNCLPYIDLLLRKVGMDSHYC